MKKIFLPIFLFLISSSSQSFFGFGEGSIKDVNKCIKENNSGLIKESVIKQKCIEKYEIEREQFKLKKYFGPSSTYRTKLDGTTLYLSTIEGDNPSGKVLTGITYIVYFYGDNGKLIDKVKGNKVDLFIEPGSYTKFGGNILKNKHFKLTNKKCKGDSTSNCYKTYISSIHTLNIDI